MNIHTMPIRHLARRGVQEIPSRLQLFTARSQSVYGRRGTARTLDRAGAAMRESSKFDTRAQVTIALIEGASMEDEVLIGGIEKRAIYLVEYDPSWPMIFIEHERRIRNALGSKVSAVEHVGSTSVPGLAAKPIIDIIVVVADSSKEDTYLPPLVGAGYLLRVERRIGTNSGCSGLRSWTFTSMYFPRVARKYRGNLLFGIGCEILRSIVLLHESVKRKLVAEIGRI